MIRRKGLFFAGVLVSSSAFSVNGNVQANGSWEQIGVPLALAGYTVAIGDEQKQIFPSCALGDPYSFHFKSGKTDKLLVYFNGGGACWDFNTCVGSLFGDAPAYVPSANVANDPGDMGGILDEENGENPYADWSMLFISYCTGDVHAGSNVARYPDSPFPISHRGFDNFLFAMNWLKERHPEIRPGKILTAGSSAGSYGAALNYPWVRVFYPSADKVFLIGDGGVGVLTGAEAFSQAVFGEASVWGLTDTLHPLLLSVPSTVVSQPQLFVPEVYALLRSEYPKQKFAQYTTAYDAIQVFFWDIMLNPETPAMWGSGLSNSTFIASWSGHMRLIDASLQSQLPDNYRSYIGPGCNHTVLRFDDNYYGSSLTSSSGNTITFLEWLGGMTGGKGRDRRDWQDLSCIPGSTCGEASLTEAGINACLARTFGSQ